jgi:glycosyltransferase involved in cell wall biosynthesis
MRTDAVGAGLSDVLVSFVVPAYNEEALIASSLAAILAEISRTGCQAEIIVVNNGSTDDATRQIASSTPGVKVVDEPQRGLVQARRAGCLASKGELIANIDADTILPEGWLGTALTEFSRRPNLVALSGPVTHYDLDRWARFVAAGFYRCAYIVHLLTRFVQTGSVMLGGNCIVSKRALEAAGGFNPEFRFWGEDAELARRLSKVGVVRFTFALRALSSGRRFAGEGLFKVLSRYSANYLWTILFKQPLSSKWLDIRHPTGTHGSPESGASNPLRLGPTGAGPVRPNSSSA